MVGFTLNKLIYSIKEEFNQLSDDTTFSDDYLSFQISLIRADYIQRVYSNPTKFPAKVLFSKVCLELEILEGDCTDNFTVLRSKNIIPDYIETFSQPLRNIKLGGYDIKYLNFIDHSRIPYITTGKVFTSQVYISIDNGYLNIVIPNSRYILAVETNYLELEIIANDPEQVFNNRCTKCVNEENCDDYFEAIYPIDGTVANIVLQTLRQTIISKFRIPEDKLNDGDSSNNQANLPNYPLRNYRKEVDNDTNNSQE